MLVTPKYLVDPEGHELLLTHGGEYEVLGLESDWFRIMNDRNDPVLYSPGAVRVLDPAEPEFWRHKPGEEGERYAYPEPWARVGFFEDFHDRIPGAREIFWAALPRFYPQTAARVHAAG